MSKGQKVGDMATDLLAIAAPGSQPLNPKYEKYCHLRAALVPRAQAYCEAGWKASDYDGAYSHACRLERRPGVKARIADRPETDVSRLSDVELLQQLADQAKALGVSINLNYYDFAQLPPAAEADSSPPVVDVTSDAGVTTADAVDAVVAAELKIAAQPEVAGARPVRAARLKK
jgi:hypothetical protein